MHQTTRDFWNDRYRQKTGETSGKPGLVLSQFAGPLAPGRALEMGCGRGDDALWLARQGWQVTAVDVSAVALAYAADSASRAGLAGTVQFEEHDLAETFPEGMYDLVVVSFLQSPRDWPRARVLARAAGAVSTGGHLLITEHASHPPGSKATEGTIFPTAEETLASLALDPRQWRRLCVCAIARMGTRDEVQGETVEDNVIFMERLG
ncbi:SAM-dependent methyltransferase [Paracoccus denitrificans]|uniref:Methyltransferase type 11 n=1 Tax=Paracoccus denitrificans (strain Pd 1222) TaxID=318586 RepID=A1B1Y1_PARDP|nr:class I SAM-dependent methyltransferase [Paracoccus denitrificans]ABL69525.1 Methyltransferase type 11 [Paracoccus denitrificans PD1222]MBB4626774.1 SAM-dependent methyltransferase [Paracoccus denitrificans]